MVLETIVPFLPQFIKDPVDKYVLLPVKRLLCYPFKYESKVNKLKEVTDQLKNRRERVEQSVDDARRKGDEIYDNVTQWLITSAEATEEAQQVVHSKVEAAKKRCFMGLCPDMKTRYQLSKIADKKAKAVDKVRNEEGLYSISYRPPPKQIVAPSVYIPEALESRVKILKEVMDALKDPNLSVIGVHGMGGVGKTTLAKEVHRQAQTDKLFDVVVMVSVSQTPDLRRIQVEIAEALGMKLDEEGMLTRAGRLCDGLKKKKILIILDDIWKQLQLREVGIPFRDDSRDCKILLTSRRLDVLCSEMGTQRNFRLEVLPEKEAWSLFKIKVNDATNEDLPPVAIEVAKRCAGLPLLILKVAMDLKNKGSYAWNDKLKQLSEFDNEDIQAKIHSILEESYNNLPNHQLKSFFLLCGLFGQSNIQIKHLLMYCVGLGLFKHGATINDARNRVFTLIDELKAESLLLDGDMKGFVKMHDVVRDTAMSIASRVQHAFIGSSDFGPKERPDKNCTRIFLPYIDMDELPEGLECPETELLFLNSDDLSLKIPDSFFERIEKLKVLDLNGIHFKSLPSSVASLANLTTLCLHRCQLDGEGIDVIGELKLLEVLSFTDSYITRLPIEIKQLSRLKLLDLSDCPNLQVLPANVLSRLSFLEELYMRNSFVDWETEGNARLGELECLSRLSTLEMQLLDGRILPWDLFLNLNGLRNYKIIIGDSGFWKLNKDYSRMLKLKLETNIHSEQGVLKLLKETEYLYLEDPRGIKNMMYDLNGDGFPQLKNLHVVNNTVIQHIVDSKKWSSNPAFPILESLSLNNLGNLENICHGQLAADSFKKLKDLTIGNCDRLTTLFLLRSNDQEDIVNDGVVELTHLRSLTLDNLPQLKSFCNGKMESVGESTHGAPSSLFNPMVSLPNLEDLKIEAICCQKIWQNNLSAEISNLTSLTVDSCNNLKYLFTITIVKSLSQLKSLNIQSCHSMEEIICTEEAVEEAERMSKIVFPKLNTMYLIFLPNFKRFCCGHPIEFQSLTALTMHYCHALTSFVSGVEGNPDNSKTQSLFDGVVSSKLRSLSIHVLDELKLIWSEDPESDFTSQQLQRVIVSSCKSLKNIFPASISRDILQLKSLDIRDCGVEEIVGKAKEGTLEPNFKFPKLTSLKLHNLRKLKSFYPEGHSTEWPELKCVDVSGCNKTILMGSNHQQATLSEGGVSQNSILLLSNKLNPNLEELTIDCKDLMRTQFHPVITDDFCKIKVLKLVRLRDDIYPFLLRFLKNLYNAEKLVVVKAYSKILFFDETSAEEKENFGAPFCIKYLEINNSPHLKHIWPHEDRLEPLISASYVETLQIDDCNSLISIVYPLSSFQNLTTLEVKSCSKLESLVTVSIAKTMMQLKNMTVRSCGNMIEVVENIADETMDEAIFSKLRVLELIFLSKLTSFCSGNHAFSFPMLEKVKVHSCPRMEFFSLGVLNTPKLRGVTTEYSHEQFWLGNLNATVTNLWVDSGHFQLYQKNWHDQHLNRGFDKIQYLTLDGCAFLTKALSIHQLQYLNKLRKLEVRDCKSVEVVFDLEGVSLIQRHVDVLPCLTELHLIDLPMLRHYATTLNLEKFRQVELRSCQMTEALIKMEEADEEILSTIIFPSLISLVLERLPNLSSFFKGSVNIECPTLKKHSIYECPKVKTLFSTKQKSMTEVDIHSTSLFSLKVVSNLEELSLDSQCTRMILQCELPLEFFPKVKVVKLRFLPSKSCFSLFAFLHRLPSLEVLVIEISSLNHLFQFNTGREDSMIRSCGDLINLSPSSLSFNNLTTLEVTSCQQLESMIPLSVAKNLGQLVTLNVKRCDMLTEIVGGEPDRELDEIVFTKMKNLELEDLPCFKSFCSNSCIFEFTSLENVTISNCLNLTLFCSGVLRTPKLDTVKYDFGFWSSKNVWEGDLNATIQKMHMNMVGLKKLESLELSKFPLLKANWNGQFPFEDLDNLWRLVVDECPSFFHAIPSNLFHYLDELSVLIVKKCDCIEEVFDLEAPIPYEADDVLKNLKELQLIDLPRLRHVWNKDPHGVLCFHNLELLQVQNCSCLTHIFTVSMASSLGNLKSIQVERCSLVEHILIIEDEENQLPKTIFPSLESINLESLPSLSSFCSGNEALKCPSLVKVDVVGCPKMNLFPSFKAESSMIVEVKEESLHNDILISPLFDGKIAMPSLEEIYVEWNTIENLLHQRFWPEFFCHLKSLTLKCYPGELPLFPSYFLEKAPNLENKFVVSDPFLHEVSSPPRLRVLVSSSTSFQNLTALEVSKCNALVNLVTATAARSLVQLKIMDILDCEMMQKIVASEVDGVDDNDEIEFSQLTSLTIHGLPSLTSFCSGNFVFNFPTLEKVKVTDCPNMKTFAKQVMTTPKLWKVQTGEKRYEWDWEGSLNDTIEALSMQLKAEATGMTSCIMCSSSSSKPSSCSS